MRGSVCVVGDGVIKVGSGGVNVGDRCGAGDGGRVILFLEAVGFRLLLEKSAASFLSLLVFKVFNSLRKNCTCFSVGFKFSIKGCYTGTSSI